MTHLYLIRHGRTTWNDEGRMQGWADPPLDAVGRQQALALAARLAGARFDAVYSSPLLRARATAEAVAAAHGLRVNFDERLRERNIGDWTGLTFEEARARDPERFDADWRRLGPPGGESQAELAARANAAVDDIAASFPRGTIAVVSHGGALSAYLAHALGIPPERDVSFSFHNTAVARLNLLPDGPRGVAVRLLSLGDDRHLDEPLPPEML
ncbi:MAG: histidine phosphatase family protein [Anaerolineales bacterium]